MRTCLIFAIVVFSFFGCKKGQDDPFLSFKSRDKRIQQEWELKEMHFLDKNESNGNTFITETFVEASKMTRYHTENSNTQVTSGSYTMTLNIKKGGEYNYTQILDGESVAYNLVWNWIDTDKKKTRIRLWDFEFTYLYRPLTVQRLSAKELILSGHFVNDQTYAKQTCEAYLVFTRKK